MAKKTKTQLLRETIRRDLLIQLDRHGTAGAHYADLVDDYMELWDTKNGLIEDIRARGKKVKVVAASGIENIKTNDSVPDLLKVNAQMAKLLDSLGIEPAPEPGGEGGDEEM